MHLDVLNSIPQRPTAVYRMYDASGDLLYIGVSVAPNVRLAQHRHTGEWVYSVARIDLQWFPDGRAAREAEREAVLSEKPRHNVAYVDPGAYRSDRQIAGPVLAAWLNANGSTAEEFADWIGVKPKKLDAIINCELRPRRDLAEKIEAATWGEIPACIWARGGRVERFSAADGRDRALALLLQHGAAA